MEHPMYDSLDHMLDHDVDYTEQDRERSERWTWLAESLPWATLAEVEILTKRKDFPGIFSSFTELGAFVDKVTKGRSRRVPCRISAGSFTVSAQVDLISGRTYMVNDGRYEQTDLVGYLTIEVNFKGKARTIHSVSSQGKAELSPRDVQYVIEGLGAAKLLPPL
jgi:hypothetical protein